MLVDTSCHKIKAIKIQCLLFSYIQLVAERSDACIALGREIIYPVMMRIPYILFSGMLILGKQQFVARIKQILCKIFLYNYAFRLRQFRALRKIAVGHYSEREIVFALIDRIVLVTINHRLSCTEFLYIIFYIHNGIGKSSASVAGYLHPVGRIAEPFHRKHIILRCKRGIMCNGGIAQSAYKICVKIFLRPLRQLHPVKIIVLGDLSFKFYRIVVLDGSICRCAYIHVCVENTLRYDNYSQYRTNRFESELLKNSESHSQNIQCRKSAEDN